MRQTSLRLFHGDSSTGRRKAELVVGSCLQHGVTFTRFCLNVNHFERNSSLAQQRAKSLPVGPSGRKNRRARAAKALDALGDIDSAAAGIEAHSGAAEFGFGDQALHVCALVQCWIEGKSDDFHGKCLF